MKRRERRNDVDDTTLLARNYSSEKHENHGTLSSSLAYRRFFPRTSTKTREREFDEIGDYGERLALAAVCRRRDLIRVALITSERI